MNFQKLAFELGEKMAIKICLSRGSIDFLQNIKTEEKHQHESQKLREALASILKDSVLENLFLTELAKNHFSFSFEWWHLLCCYEIPDNTRSYAVKQMETKMRATSFDNWRAIYRATNEHAVKENAIQKMCALATSCQEWHYLMRQIFPASEKDFAISKMKEGAVSFHDFDTLRDEVPKNSADYKYALLQMKETAKSFDDWRYLLIYMGDADHRFIVEKMYGTASSLYNLHSVWENSSLYPEIQSSAWVKMEHGTFTFFEWNSLLSLDVTKRQPDIKRLCLEKMRNLASSLKELKYLYEEAKKYPDVQNFALEMIAKLSS